MFSLEKNFLPNLKSIYIFHKSNSKGLLDCYVYGIRFNWWRNWNFGTGALSGKMLLIGFAENNKIDDYFRAY